jgi:hypothetical protein
VARQLQSVDVDGCHLTLPGEIQVGFITGTSVRRHVIISFVVAVAAIPRSAEYALTEYGTLASMDTVDLKRVLTIEASERCLLERVIGLELSSKNELFVADRRANEVCHFDQTGRLVRTIGRKGEGPGEFTDLAWLTRLPGDSIVALDGIQLRLTYVHPRGDGIRTARLEVPGEAVSRTVTAFKGLSTGRFLVGFSAVQRVPPALTPVAFDQLLFIVNGDGRPVGSAGRTFASEHFVQTVPPQFGGIAYWDLAFGRRASVSSAWNGTLAYSDGQTSAVRILDHSGRPVRTLTAPVRREPVTPRDIARFKATELETTSARQLRLQNHRLAEMPYPSTYPTIGDIFTGTTGAVFAQAYSSPVLVEPVTRWYMWSSEQSPVKVFQARGRFRSMAASDTRLCGIETDSDDVATIVCFGLQ